MIVVVNNLQFKDRFYNIRKSKGNQKESMYEIFVECFKEYFGEVVVSGEDIYPYLISEECISDLFFKAVFECCKNEFKRLGYIKKEVS